MNEEKWVKADGLGLHTVYRKDQEPLIFTLGLVGISSMCYTAYRAVRGIVGLIKK